MKEKIEFAIREIEKWAEMARQQQKLSRDRGKQLFWLGKANTAADSIGLLKRTFNKELFPNTSKQVTPLTNNNK